MVAVENVEELKDRLSGILARYDTIVYSEDSLKAAQADKRELTKLRKQIEEQCNAVKTAYLAPYEAFEKQVKVLLDMVDGPLNAAKRFIQEMDKREKEAKKEVIRAYFLSRTSDLGEWAEALWNSSNFFDPRWLNKGTTMLMWRDSLDKKLKAAVAGLRRTPILEAPAAPSPKPAETMPVQQRPSVQPMAPRPQGPQAAAALSSQPIPGHQQGPVPGAQPVPGPQPASVQASQSAPVAETPPEQHPVGRPFPAAVVRGAQIVRLTGTGQQLVRALELAESVGVTVDELEEELNWGFPERQQPDFRDYTAISVKTTGPDAAGKVEIVEISAVRMRDGLIQDKRKSLLQPGQKMHPMATMETGITDEMLEGMPTIAQKIGPFLEFIGDDIVVGYRIARRDLFYIGEAAARVGLTFTNPFFDIARYLQRTGKSVPGGLEGLAERMNLRFEGHRAIKEARLAANLYEKLKSRQ